MWKAKHGLTFKWGLKTKLWSIKLIFEQIPFLGEREREEKRGEELGLEKDQVFVRFLPIFLTLCDQAT